MNRHVRTQIIAAALCGLCLTIGYILLGCLAADAMAHDHDVQRAPAPRAVALSDARVAPDYLRLVKPGRWATPARAIRSAKGAPCKGGGFFSDVQAYRWDGRPLAAQAWDDSLPGWSWTPKGSARSVGYDGLTFYNGLRVAVLVAGWCE